MSIPGIARASLNATNRGVVETPIATRNDEYPHRGMSSSFEQFADIARTSMNGSARVRFKAPNANGDVLLLAIAGSEDRFGYVANTVTIVKRIRASIRAPEVVSSGEPFECVVVVENNIGRDATFRVRLEADGIDIVGGSGKSAWVEAGERREIIFQCEAAVAGNETLSATVTAIGRRDEARATVRVE